MKVSGEYTVNMARDFTTHFLRGEQLDARGGYHSSIQTPLPSSLQISLEDVSSEDDSDWEVKIFVPNPNIPNMEEYDADE